MIQPYEEQLTLLAAQDFSHPSSAMALPGNVNAVDRFQRAAYYSALLPTPISQRQAVAGVMAIMRTSRSRSVRPTPTSASRTPNTARCAT